MVSVAADIESVCVPVEIGTLANQYVVVCAIYTPVLVRVVEIEPDDDLLVIAVNDVAEN